MRTALLPVLVFVVLRLALLGTNFDVTCMPNYELAPMGQVAWSVAHGVGPKGLGAYYDNCGGHLLVGLAAGPLFAAFGERYLWLKVVTLATGVATLLVTRRALRRHVGSGAAIGFSWAFALGTPALLQASCLAMGNHAEGLLVQALLLAVGWDACRTPDARRSAGLGLTVGLGAFAYLGSLPLALPLLATWAVVVARDGAGERGPRAPRVAALVGGLGLGLLPLVWVQGASGGRPTGFLAHALGGDWVGRLGELGGGGLVAVVERAARASSSPGWLGVPGVAFDAAFVIVACAVWFAAIARLRRPGDRVRLAPLVGCLAATVVLLAVVRLRQAPVAEPMQVVGRRYLLTGQYLTLVVGSIVGARALAAWRAQDEGWRDPWPAAVARSARVVLTGLGALALAVGLSGLGWLRLRPDETGQALAYDGVHGPYWASAILRDALDEPAEVERRVATLPPDVRDEALRGIGCLLAVRDLGGAGRGTFAAGARALLAPWPEVWRAPLLRGVGTHLRGRVPYHGAASEPVRAALAELVAGDPELAGLVLEGAGMEYEYPLVRLLDGQWTRTHALAAALPGDTPPALVARLWSGHGETCGRVRARGLGSDARRFEAELSRVPDAHREAFLRGAAAGATRAGRPGRAGVDAVLAAPAGKALAEDVEPEGEVAGEVTADG